jgi:hypothetical protein
VILIIAVSGAGIKIYKGGGTTKNKQACRCKCNSRLTYVSGGVCTASLDRTTNYLAQISAAKSSTNQYRRVE